MGIINFSCSKCNEEIEMDSNEYAESVTCPKCANTVLVPFIGMEADKEVGKFKLKRRLGTGGMGEVWLAFNMSTDELVALKILSPGLAKSKDFLSRFYNEVETLKVLNHKNIVKFIEAGQDGNINYLAISYIDGVELGNRLKIDKFIPEKEALEIALQIAEALEYAWHHHKFLHRDIKPANIMVESESKLVKLMDMGISKSIADDASLTMTGVIVGTPYYMSPEQAKGEKYIDYKTDIYALGGSLYHLMTGHVPYNSSTAMGIVAKHITAPIPDPQKANPKISDNAKELLQTMMAKEIDKRPATWSKLCQDIRLVLDGKSMKSEVSPVIDHKSLTIVADKILKQSSTLVKNPKVIVVLALFFAICAILLSVSTDKRNDEVDNNLSVKLTETPLKKITIKEMVKMNKIDSDDKMKIEIIEEGNMKFTSSNFKRKKKVVVYNANNIIEEPRTSSNHIVENKLNYYSLAGKLDQKRKHIEWKPKWYFEGTGGPRLKETTMSDDKTVICFSETIGEKYGPFGTRLIFMDTANWNILKIITLEDKFITKLKWSFNDTLVCFSKAQKDLKTDNSLFILNPITEKIISSTAQLATTPSAICANDQDDIIVSMEKSKDIYVFNAKNLNTFFILKSSIMGGAIDFLPYENQFIVAGNNKYEIFDIKSKLSIISNKLEYKIKSAKVKFINNDSFLIASEEGHLSYYKNNKFNRLLSNICSGKVEYNKDINKIFFEEKLNNKVVVFNYPKMDKFSEVKPSQLTPKFKDKNANFLGYIDASSRYVIFDNLGNLFLLHKPTKKWRKTAILTISEK